jgi:ribosomal protein L32
MQTRSQTRAQLQQAQEVPKTMRDFIRVGEPINEKAQNDNSDATEHAWRQFQLDAKRALVLNGKDKRLRRDCWECTHYLWRCKDRTLERCRECGDFKTFHKICHYCAVMMAIYQV